MTSLNPDAATGVGNTLIFNNTTLEVDPTTFSGLFTVSGYYPLWSSGVSSWAMIPDLTSRVEISTGEGDVFTPGTDQIVPPSFDLTIQGQPHTFLFSVMNEYLVAMPDVAATYNTTPSIPVTLSDAAAPIVSAEVFVSYDGDVVTALSTDLTGTLAATGWTAVANIVEGNGTNIDTAKIAMATDDDAIAGDGTLILINFLVADHRSPASTPLTLEHVLLNDGDPGHTRQDGSVTVVGTDGILACLVVESGSTTKVIPRETIQITVTDIDENREGALVDHIDVDVSTGVDAETVTLDESAVGSGVFTGTMATVFSLGFTAEDGKLQTQAEDVVQIDYTDLLNDQGATVTRTVTKDVIGGADGTVEASLATQPGDDLESR